MTTYTNPGGGYGDISRYDDFPVNDHATKNASPFIELGGTGLKRAAGIVDEEFLPALRGRKAIKVFREMYLNDPTIGSMLFAIEQLIRQVEWTVTSEDTSDEGQKHVEFVESCMEDMSHTWDDMISEILSMLPYGFSWHEIVYKKRIGPWEKDPKRRSRHQDGMIGWRKIPIRSQETHLRWIFDKDGGVKGMVQIPPPYYKTNVIPIERSLLFRTGSHKGNPEGKSLLRNAYRPWFYKKRLEEFEAIGVERDLAGMPVAWVPNSYMAAKPGTNEEKVYKAFKKMVQNVRRDEHEGLVLPLAYDPESKKELFRFELMSSGGGRSFDTNALINRYEQRILQTVLADFIMLGESGKGSYAMHVDKTGIFRAALDSIVSAIADVFNRHAIPRLFELNGIKPDVLPRFTPGNVDPPNLAELAQFMTSMAGLGMQFFPDPDLEKFLRDTAHLPEIPEDQLEMRREMAQQQQFMEYAQSRIMAVGAAQKDNLVEGQGMSPEQAEMAVQGNTPEMAAQEELAAYKGQAIAEQDPDVKAKKEEELGMQREQEQMQMVGDQQKMGMEQEKFKQKMLQEEEKHKLQLKLAQQREKAKPTLKRKP